MSETLFLNIIYRYFIKSVVLARDFKLKFFDRYYKLSIGSNKAPITNKKQKIGFLKYILTFILKIFGVKKKELSELEKYLKERNEVNYGI